MSPGEDARRAYIVDDDEGFRRSLELLLDSNGWTVSSFASAGELLAHAPHLDPGLLLLDLHLPGMSGLDLLESGRTELGRFGIVMITGAGEIQTAVRSIKAGALDFLEKPFEAGDALARLDRIDALFRRTLGDRSQALEAKRRVERLSSRERHVLERLLAGASNKHIARDLDLSPRTVEMHRARMLQKLAAASTAQALELGRLAGLEPVAPSRGA